MINNQTKKLEKQEEILLAWKIMLKVKNLFLMANIGYGKKEIAYLLMYGVVYIIQLTIVIKTDTL